MLNRGSYRLGARLPGTVRGCAASLRSAKASGPGHSIAPKSYPHPVARGSQVVQAPRFNREPVGLRRFRRCLNTLARRIGSPEPAVPLRGGNSLLGRDNPLRLTNSKRKGDSSGIRTYSGFAPEYRSLVAPCGTLTTAPVSVPLAVSGGHLLNSGRDVGICLQYSMGPATCQVPISKIFRTTRDLSESTIAFGTMNSIDSGVMQGGVNLIQTGYKRVYVPQADFEFHLAGWNCNSLPDGLALSIQFNGDLTGYAIEWHLHGGPTTQPRDLDSAMMDALIDEARHFLRVPRG